MFDPEGGSNRAGRQNPRKPSNDDPIILNVETDGGDGPQPSSNVPPKRPSGPRITSKPNRPRKPSNGSKIFIGVVLALAVCLFLKAKMKSVRQGAEADAYVTAEGLNLTEQYDNYTHTTETRRKISRDSDSDSSSHSGGGGSGSSGKY